MEQRTPILQEYRPAATLAAEDYEPYIGRERVEELKRLAEPLAGRRWANVNSTHQGGGVAELLRSLIPLARGLGLDARWYVMNGREDFFRTTKMFHNLLQGVAYSIPVAEIFKLYIDISNEHARSAFVAADVVEIHDPQPLATIMNGTILGRLLWRCHIDTSVPDQELWRYLLPYINGCGGAIFTTPEFLGPGLRLPLYQIAPCIDPRAEKNRHHSRGEALAILDPLFALHGVDPERPILAAVSRYDIHKNQGTILKAFQRVREESRGGPRPYLIFLGNTATDDPEGGAVLEKLLRQAGDDPDIRFWVNVPDNDRVVSALMRVARGFVHVSTREGFGLVVTEALWQGTPVLGSRVGGIKDQVVDGETGYLVDPLDVDAVASRMARLLEHPEEAALLGARGRERVCRHFLLPEMVRRYLLLLRFCLGVERQPPAFRLAGIDGRRGGAVSTPLPGAPVAGL